MMLLRPLTVRYCVSSFATQHYRKPINFTEKLSTCSDLKYLKNTYEQLTDQADSAQLQALLDKFTAAMDEDFTANGITAVFEQSQVDQSGNHC